MIPVHMICLHYLVQSERRVMKQTTTKGNDGMNRQGEQYAGDARLCIPRTVRETTAAVPERRPMVYALMDDIRGRLSEAHDGLSELEVRLGGVLSPSAPQDKKSGPEEGGMPELVRQLKEVRGSLEGMVERVADIRARLEV